MQAGQYKEQLRIAFVDMWDPWDLEDFITPILVEHYKVILDNKNPDVVFHSIFGGMKETPKYKCKKILILAENHRPEQFGSDYSISFDPNSEKNFRLPLWQMYWLLNPKLKDRLFNRKQVANFKEFASFTVSNGSNAMRNNHYDQLNSYKKVMAYGAIRRNSFALQKHSNGKYWRYAKDEFFLDNSHKFMMAYENSSYPGYCTEKLMDAFLVGSLPIYWGCSMIHKDWNENAFINVNKLGSNWLERIKDIDKSDKLFEEIYNEPVFTDSQKQKHLDNIEGFERWLIEKIIE